MTAATAIAPKRESLLPKTPRPRLLHLTTSAMSLGWLLEPQLHAFVDAGFDVVTASAPGPLAQNLQNDGISHIPIHSFARSVDVSADLRAVRELRDVLRHARPDIIHTHNPKPGIIGRLLARSEQVPIVVNTVHGLYAQPNDPLRRRLPVYGLERLAATCSDAELVQSVEDVETLRRLGVPSSRLHLLGNGIDLERFTTTQVGRSRAIRLRRELGLRDDVPVVGVIGRLVWEKGYSDFFQAVEWLKANSHSPFEVVVVGPREPSKADAVGERDIERLTKLGVRFLGSRDDIDSLLELMDIFVLPSRREGFPRAAMEACAMGVPVIATNIRGCRQVVRHEHNGLLYEPGVHRQLAASIQALLDNEVGRRRLGAAGAVRARVEFDQERVISRTLSVYRQLMRRR